MTKFGKVEKIGCSRFWFRTTQFWPLRGQVKKGAKLEDLMIQGCFENGKGKQGIKGPRQKKFMPNGGSRENQMFRFRILDGPFFQEQVDSD
jgi:hypothetical protein